MGPDDSKAAPGPASSHLRTCLALGVLAVSIGGIAGPGAEVLAILYFVVPCWVFQTYDACLANVHPPSQHADIVRKCGHDIRYLGALFLMSAIMDLYIIVAQPQDVLAVFCTKPEGWLGLLFKIQFLPFTEDFPDFCSDDRASSAPLLYAGFGLTNALVVALDTAGSRNGLPDQFAWLYCLCGATQTRLSVMNTSGFDGIHRD